MSLHFDTMAEADVKLTTVPTDGEKLGNLIPANGLSKTDGKKAIVGKWQIPGGPLIDITLSGSSVRSVQTPFGNQQFMAEVEESEEKFGLHVTMGGFPMKAWLVNEGGGIKLKTTNGGNWSKM